MRCPPISPLVGAIHESPKKTSHALERILLLRRGRRKLRTCTSLAERAASSLRAGLREGEKHFGLTLSPPCRNAIPGPASLRPANGAAAEIAGSLYLPLAAGASNSSCFSTAAQKAACLLLPPAAAGRFSPNHAAHGLIL